MQIKALIISNYRNSTSARPEAEFIIGLQQSGIQITVMTYPDAPYCNTFKEKGIRVLGFHPEKKRSRHAVLTIRKELIEGQYDILHLFNSKAIYNGIRAAKGLLVKVVLYRGYTGGIHWYDPLAYSKYLSPRVDKITCLSQSVEAMFRRTPFFQKDKAITINKGHHPDWYKDIRPADLSQFDIPDGAFVISHVSNARKMKGIPYLLCATHLIPPGLPIHLLLIGNNMDTPGNRKLIQQSPYRAHIHITGYRTDGLELVKASDMFVLPSLFGEATTKALIEAMSLGVAPLATKIAGNKELVIDGENAIVVPPGDASALARGILSYYHDAALRNQHASAAQQYVQTRFHTDETVRQLQALYTSLTTD